MSLKVDATIKNLINLDKVAKASKEFQGRSFCVGYLENSPRKSNPRLSNGQLMHWLHNGTSRMQARPLFEVIEKEYNKTINEHFKQSFNWFVDTTMKRKNSDSETIVQKAFLTFLTQLKNTMLLHWEDPNVQKQLAPLKPSYKKWKAKFLKIPESQVRKLVLFKELKSNLTFTTFKGR